MGMVLSLYKKDGSVYRCRECGADRFRISKIIRGSLVRDGIECRCDACDRYHRVPLAALKSEG